MSLQDVRDQLARQRVALSRTIADVDALLAGETETPPADVVPVHPGDDLAAMIAGHPPGTIFALDAGVTATDLVITKSCTLQGPGGDDPAPQRPIMSGTVTITAPAVTLDRIAVVGLRPPDTLVTCAAETRLIDCVLTGSEGGQKRGLAVNAAGIVIEHTIVENCWYVDDAQAICGWSGTRDLVVHNCVLEASGENIMLGGADAASEDDIPNGVLIDHCLLRKRPEWRGQAGCTVKNLFELKCAKHVGMRNCTLEYCWQSGQDGYGIVLTVRNQDGGAPYSTIEDVQIEDCTIKHVGGGINILGRDDTYPSAIMRNVTIRRCRFEDVNHWTWGGSGRTVQIMGGPVGLTLEALTVQTDAMLNSALYLDYPAIEGLTVKGCEWYEGEYGIFGGGTLGEPALAAYAPGYQWANVIVHKTQAERWIQWPTGTTVRDETQPA